MGIAPSLRLPHILSLVLMPILLLATSCPGHTQTYTFTGHVYLGQPPDVTRPVPGIAVELYGLEDASSERGARILLRRATTSRSGAFRLTWEPARQSFPLYQVVQVDPEHTVSTGAQVGLPGRVESASVISFLDIPPGDFEDIDFWDDIVDHHRSPRNELQLPDLSIENLWATEDVASGDDLVVRALVKNTGTTTVSRLQIQFLLDEQLFQDPVHVNHLEPGWVEEVVTVGTAPRPGEHLVVALVDPHDRITERDENNNRATRPVRVREPGRDRQESVPDRPPGATIDPGSRPTAPGTASGIEGSLRPGAALAGSGANVLQTLGDALIIGTYNVQFLPTFFNPRSDSDDDVKRSARIAKRIIASGYDVIALNEVFDEDARRVFIRDLGPTYPHHVGYITGPGFVEDLQDSGLMLFSRFPFESLPKSTHKLPWPCLGAVSGGSNWADVAFLEFEECDDSDCWAAKGVAYVRARVPSTGRALHLIFTHLQASYDDDDHGDWIEKVEIRKSQLETVRRLILDSMTLVQIQNEEIFILGDMNIDGDQADPNLGWRGGVSNNLFEWKQRLGSGIGFYSLSVHDSWARETSPQDRGLTNYGGQTRLDYILRNRFLPGDPEGLCLQHLTRAFNLRDRGEEPGKPGHGPPYHATGLGTAGWIDLSDHLGVNAVLNRWAPHCCPPEAATPAVNQTLSGTITHPGSMQWFRFDQQGTYVFAILGGGGARRQVYQAIDLSTPQLPYGNETVTVTDAEGQQITTKKFQIPRAPFYVRVSNPSPATTGPYKLFTRRFNGDSQATAVILRPNQPLVHDMPTSPLNANDQVWFELDLEAADSGKQQALRFTLEPQPFTGNVFTLSLLDAKSLKEIDRATPMAASGPPARIEISRRIAGPQKFYLVARRKVSSHPTIDVSFTIGWETSLNVLHGAVPGAPNSVPLTLICDTQTDLIGDDTISLTVTVDGTARISNQSLGDFDEEEYKNLDAVIGVIRFVDRVVIELEEYDSGSANDHLKMWIEGMSPQETEQRNASIWSADTPVFGHSGAYTFRYNLSRTLY